MIDLVCSKCDGDIYENALATTFEYNKDIKVLMSENGELDVKMAPKYMMFACPKCGFTRKISFDDYITSKQTVVLETLGKLRSDSSVRTLDPSLKYSEDSGLAFCGVCPGLFDGDGICTNDVIAGCAIRRRILGD